MTTLTKAEIERIEVEYVFGLTGGELRDERWAYGVPQEEGTYSFPVTSRSAPYWFEGVPDYAESDFDDLHDAQYRTIVVSGGGFLSTADEVIVDSQGEWKLVDTFANSGETACCYDSGAHEIVQPEECNGPAGNERCPYCEAEVGEEHGCIYIGDGYEAVYRLNTCTQCVEDPEPLPVGQSLCDACKADNDDANQVD